MVQLDHAFVNYKKEFLKKSGLEEKPSMKRFWAQKFNEFCKRTDLHGFKYVVMQDFNIVERSCWLLAIVISGAIAIYFVYAAFQWFVKNPIITVIESTQRDVWDVPFPAVTICDLNKISRKAAREFANNLMLPPNATADFIFETLRLAPLLHANYISELRQKQDLYLLQTILDMNNVSIAELFRKLSPAKSCAHLVEKCMWKNILYECEYLFKQVFSLISLCCTFNYYAVDPTFYRETLSHQAFQNGSPRHVASCGYQTALTVVINTDANDYYSASVASQGALVFVDNAYNIPDMDSSVRMVNPSTEVMIALSPETTYTTLGVRSFRPDDRKCYYEDEIRLGGLRQYSFHNCMAYRKFKTIERICGCFPFFFPSIDKHRHCNFKDLECLQFLLKPSRDMKIRRKSGDELEIQCLPDCEHYSYPLKVSLGNLAKNVHLNGHSFYNGYDIENRSLLNVFFNDLESTRYRRDVYLNWQNVLASFGGLLSLMLGFTLIAGFDVVLFFITRIGYDSMKTRSDLNSIGKTKVNVYKKKI